MMLKLPCVPEHRYHQVVASNPPSRECVCVCCSDVPDSLPPYSPPDSSVHGILQVRILEWAAIPFSRGSS